MYIFLIFALLLFWGIYWLISKKLNIENKILYNHVNEIRKEVEILLLVAWIVSSVIIVLINPAAFGFHFIFIWLTVLSTFRAYMEWKFDKRSKRYILSIIAAGFFLIVFLGFEFVFTNPVPVRLEADQVEEITIEHYSESEDSYTITLTDEELINPILSTLSDGRYQIGTHPITPRLEMIIKLKNGREIVIEEFITRTSGDRSVIFMVHTERILFPRDMMLFSQELELIFEDFADKIAIMNKQEKIEVNNIEDS